ncbi:MAG: glycerol-3-phosphate acyltransferase [Anaerolineaceae bacterium]|nr:glycerol-3-phosphate acyltransferase [Anaerolineaceae bacterium]
MHILTIAGVLLGAYLIGAIPSGYLIVKFSTGKDIRTVESGRTGGTNAMRAAGIVAGIGTAIFDFLKGAAAVWLARWAMPEIGWMPYIAPVIAIIGHNYSVFLLEYSRKTGWRMRGGAGGATCVGGSFGLWPPSLLIIVPMAAAIWYGIGYASVTTMSIALLSLIIFAYRAALGLSPWAYVIYSGMALVLLAWSLRPNIRRLINGTERLHGWRALKLKRAEKTIQK